MHFQVLNMHQIRLRPGGAHDAPPDPLVGWGGDTFSPLPLPARRLRRLALRAFGSASRPLQNYRQIYAYV